MRRGLMFVVVAKEEYGFVKSGLLSAAGSAASKDLAYLTHEEASLVRKLSTRGDIEYKGLETRNCK